MKLYRLDAVHYTDGIRLQMAAYDVTRETPRGYWIALWPKKWVSKTTRKRFAHQTQDDALFAFKKRKERQIAILTEQLASARTALSMAENNVEFEPVLDALL
jgi:hypothetical protein